MLGLAHMPVELLKTDAVLTFEICTGSSRGRTLTFLISLRGSSSLILPVKLPCLLCSGTGDQRVYPRFVQSHHVFLQNEAKRSHSRKKTTYCVSAGLLSLLHHNIMTHLAINFNVFLIQVFLGRCPPAKGQVVRFGVSNIQEVPLSRVPYAARQVQKSVNGPEIPACRFYIHKLKSRVLFLSNSCMKVSFGSKFSRRVVLNCVVNLFLIFAGLFFFFSPPFSDLLPFLVPHYPLPLSLRAVPPILLVVAIFAWLWRNTTGGWLHLLARFTLILPALIMLASPLLPDILLERNCSSSIVLILIPMLLSLVSPTLRIPAGDGACSLSLPSGFRISHSWSFFSCSWFVETLFRLALPSRYSPVFLFWTSFLLERNGVH